MLTTRAFSAVTCALLLPALLALLVLPVPHSCASINAATDESQSVSMRVAGGWAAVRGQFPHAVSIEERIFWIISWPRCEGSIISQSWVLTAAHCVERHRYNLEIVAGILNLYRTGNSEPFQQRTKVVNIVSHPDFKTESLENDLALLQLEKPLSFNRWVHPVKLPTPGSVPQGASHLSGWGGSFLFFSSLKYVVLPIISYETCRSIDSVSDRVKETNICTGPLTGGYGACEDSGSALVQYDDQGNAIQIGVVSWSAQPCGGKNRPSVYTRLSAYRDFINRTISSS